MSSLRYPWVGSQQWNPYLAERPRHFRVTILETMGDPKNRPCVAFG